MGKFLRTLWSAYRGRLRSNGVIKPCRQDIYEGGKVVAVFDSPPEVMEGVCAFLRREGAADVDWHYFGGRAVLLALPGSIQRAREVIQRRSLLTRLDSARSESS